MDFWEIFILLQIIPNVKLFSGVFSHVLCIKLVTNDSDTCAVFARDTGVYPCNCIKFLNNVVFICIILIKLLSYILFLFLLHPYVIYCVVLLVVLYCNYIESKRWVYGNVLLF